MEKEQTVLEGYLVGAYGWKMRHKNPLRANMVEELLSYP
jgi:hypothetical protein